MPSHNNRKKKKRAVVTPAAAATATTAADGDQGDPLLPLDAATSSSTSSSPPLDCKQSAYEKMSLHLITSLSPSLHLSPGCLAAKVNALPVSRCLFGIYSSEADSVGRRAIARVELSPGTLIIREQASPAVLHRAFQHKLCASCYDTLYDGSDGAVGSQQPQQVKVRGCRACECVMYCSVECMMRHSDVHRDECKVLRELDRLSDESRVNVDLLRAALAYCVMRRGAGSDEAEEEQEQEGEATETKEQRTTAAADGLRADDFRPDWQDVDELVDNLDAVAAVDLQRMQAAASLLLSLLPPRLHLPAASLVSFMSRVNNNSHAMSAASASVSSSSPHVGFGLFPLCSILNHSCYPNCLYTSHGQQLVMRVIRPVRAGEELTVNYIGLYASLLQRRRELRESKKFTCECRRCALRPATEEERDKFAFDQFVGGVRCRQESERGKRCGGIYRLMQPIVPSERRQQQRLQEQREQQQEPPITDVLLCSDCGDGLLYAELERVESEHHDKVETALSLYSAQASSASSLHAYMTSLTAALLSVFHPHHHLVFNLSLPLINLLSALQSHRERRDCIRQARTLSSRVYPPHYLPSINYMQAEVAALHSIVTAGAGKMPKKLQHKYREEQCELMRMTVDGLRVCLGDGADELKREEKKLAEHQQLTQRGG